MSPKCNTGRLSKRQPAENKGGADNTTGARPLLARVSAFFDSVANANGAAAAYDRLSLMSDAQLEALGIERADIARHVFQRYFSAT